MFSLILVPLFVGLLALYFLIKFYYLKTVYVIKPTKTVLRSNSCDINDAQRLIQIIRARRESQTSLNKFCSSNDLDDLDDDLSEVIDIEPNLNQKQSNENANLIDFTEDHIPDLKRWLESSSKINVPSSDTNDDSKDNLKIENQQTNQDHLKIDQINKQKLSNKIKYLNLNCDQLNAKQLQILTSLSYLVNEERLSIIICKLKLPFHKNLYHQFPFYKRSSLNSTNQQNYFKIYQQLELIKATKYIFVKTYLIDSTTRKRISKKKSSLLSVDGQNCILNNNPYDQNKYLTINELMIFKLPINQLSKITIRLTVFGLSSLNHLNQLIYQNEFQNRKIKKSLDTLYSFGYVEIGCNSLDKSAFLHYQNLLKNHRPICMWHTLDLSKQTKRKSSILI